MSIDWGSLLLVAVVAIGATGLFALFLSVSIRLLAQARVATEDGRPATGARTGAWIMLGLMAVMLMFGLYLIIPQFH
jgi:uncharacterized BrkB/YihY/UPF0761 family membrane protein